MARAASGGSRAVETFLRNFEGERGRYQEILEITLCYGVKCLARTFSLKGISCNELRTITGYDEAKTIDFYVRNASRPVGKERGGGVMQRSPVELRAKPSHSWRDGEVEMPDFPEPSASAENDPRTAMGKVAGDSGGGREALYSLPPAFDELDYHTKLLGKPLVDLAWKIFTGREKSQIESMSELEEIFLRVEQRKVVGTLPALALPVASFAEFLGAYLAECVRHAHPVGPAVDEEVVSTGEGITFSGKQERAWSPRAAVGNTTSAQPGSERMQRSLHPQPQQQQPRQIPRSLQHVQSKLRSELDVCRQKILRVKKTQSQRMAETLARARLAEYDARRELQDVRDRRLAPKKMPISDIKTGAAALEIADGFMKSPLMDTFGHGEVSGSTIAKHSTHDSIQQRSAQKDHLKEELYGTAALDNSFLGCKPAPEPRRRSESRSKQSKRNYNGWLGDFGPLHTKTVRPEWNEQEDEDDHSDPPGIGGTTFEWNFEHLPGGRHEPVNHVKRFGGVVKQNDEFDDDLSVNSDPVFRWLKDAV